MQQQKIDTATTRLYTYGLNPQSSQPTFPTLFDKHKTINTDYFTTLTDTILDRFYPKYCCDKKLTKEDGKRSHILRCPHCHKQQSRYNKSPLIHVLNLKNEILEFVHGKNVSLKQLMLWNKG